MKWLLALILTVTPALAKELTVNDQDQAAIQGICDLAATSPAVNRDARAHIATWCVSWEKRMAEQTPEQRVEQLLKPDKPDKK